MSEAEPAPLPASSLQKLLEVTRLLAAPLSMPQLLQTVTSVACEVLHAERCSVWLHDELRAELVLEVASDLRHVRLPIGMGLVGQCALDRLPINVPDCYADARFDPSVDQRTGFRTRCSLTLPLLDTQGVLVGVMQVLNRAGGVFGAADEALASALAAQCAVVLQRARMTAALIEGEKARQELEVARSVQMSSLPTTMPVLPGYDCHGLALPAAQTGGDTFDLAMTAQGLLLVLGDATGHGIGPALSVTQMHAMLRMALRLAVPLELAVQQLNNLLAELLADDRFITAFIGLVDPSTGVLRYHSAGQAPLLHWHAAAGRLEALGPTGFPLGAMPLAAPRAGRSLQLAPGDLLAVLSDGLYEQRDVSGEEFGLARVESLLRLHQAAPMQQLGEALVQAVRAHAGDAQQADDMSLVLLRRDGHRASFALPRRVDALEQLFAASAAFCARAGAADDLRLRLDFVLEELFTNAVKYAGGQAPLAVEWHGHARALWCELVDPDGRCFDPGQAGAVDLSLPADHRQPGGLGLHMVTRIADTIEHRPGGDGRGGRTRFAVLPRAGAA